MYAHRITGRHLFVEETGAVIWLDSVDRVAEIINRVKQGGEQLGLPVEPRVYEHSKGMAIAIDFPTDLLYTACELLEWASSPELAFEVVLNEYQKEKNLRWRALKSWANERSIPVVEDEDAFTLGLGRYAQSWALDSLPEIADLSAPDFSSIPCVYITGTNGKTTSSRMLASIVRAANYQDGLTSSDGVLVGGQWVERGDWTGPGAARMVLRHPSVDVAVLETARGGIMRRGLVLSDVEAAAVTNVSDDHLGYWGLHTVDDMARAKLTVALGVQSGGTVVLNADCVPLVKSWKKWGRTDVKVCWFSSRRQSDLYVKEDVIVHCERGEIIHIKEIPLTLLGTALHNVENAMVSIGLSCALGLSTKAIQQGLRSLTATPESSRGRSNWYQLNGADIILDFAHNPDGIKRLVEVGCRWGAKRRTIFLGQAADRSDSQICSLAKEAAILHADRYVLKELPKHAYEVDPRVVVEKIKTFLILEGVEESKISCFADEITAVQQVLNEVQPGDLILLIVHENLDSVLNLLCEYQAKLVFE